MTKSKSKVDLFPKNPSGLYEGSLGSDIYPTGAGTTGTGKYERSDYPLRSYKQFPEGTGKTLYPHSKGLKRNKKRISGVTLID